MAVDYNQSLFKSPRALSRHIDRLHLLRQSGMNFIPLGNGRTLRTEPLLEDNAFIWRERYKEAALIYLTNPLCYAAQSLINDELADARIVVEEKQGTKWVEHTNNTLIEWLQRPNPTMDIKEFVRAYSTHFHTFGSIYAIMFQKGDYLSNGKISREPNCFDIVFPARIVEDAVSNPYQIDWYYYPITYQGYEPKIFKVKNDALFMDVIYNPVAHSVGVSLPNNPLGKIFKIHELFIRNLDRFFERGGIPTHLLTRKVDITKEATAMSVTDADIDEAIQRIYARVGRGGKYENGWLGMRGDWGVNRLGSPLPDLMNKDLVHMVESLIAAVYKVPPSLFWAGVTSSNQRASRQQDSIDFFNEKITPMLDRITRNLSAFLVPKFFPKRQGRWRIHYDDSEMALAQYAITKEYRMYERWYQLKVIPRGQFLDFVREPTNKLTEEEYNFYYDGGNNQGMNAGAGDQSIEKDNGLE